MDQWVANSVGYPLVEIIRPVDSKPNQADKEIWFLMSIIRLESKYYSGPNVKLK